MRVGVLYGRDGLGSIVGHGIMMMNQRSQLLALLLLPAEQVEEDASDKVSEVHSCPHTALRSGEDRHGQ